MHCFVPRPAVAGISEFDASKCQRHLAKMCDVNYMIQRALAGDASVFRRGSYADVSAAPESLQDALNAQCRAREAFDALPDAVRARWTTPEAFYMAASTPEGRQEFVKFGLAFVPEKDNAISVRVINPSVPDKEPAPSTGAA